MNVIILTFRTDKRTGERLRRGVSHMILDVHWTQCGKLISVSDERTERRPTCLVCRAIFDPPSTELIRVALDSPPEE